MNNNCGRLECSKLLGAVSDVIMSIDERLEYYLFHVFKRLQSASLVERKRNLKIGQALKMKYKADAGTILPALYLQQ